MNYIAIEGPCLAGKTTLANGLVREASDGWRIIVPDYADYVGGGPAMPPEAPESLEVERQAIEFLLEVERRRFADQMTRDSSGDLVLIDRSFHTLIAHAVGLDEYFQTPQKYSSVVNRMVRFDRRIVEPRGIIYLDLGASEQTPRNHGKFSQNSVFLDSDFNKGFRSYFSNWRIGVPVEVISASLPAAEIVRRASVAIEKWREG